MCINLPSMKHCNFFTVSLMALLFLFISGSAVAQETKAIKVSKYFDNISLRLALIELKNEYQLSLAYDSEQLAGIRLNAVRIVRLPLDQAMGLMLAGTNLTFDLQGPRSGAIREREESESFVARTYEVSRENFTLEGVVMDEASGETLPNATVMVRSTKQGALTNLDGYFTIFKVPSDTVVLVVKYLGYQTTYVQLTPETNIEFLELPVRQVGYELDAVLISAEADESHMMNSKGISHISISPAQLSTLPSLGEKDIFRSLQLLPGISGTNEASSGLYVRGGTPDQNLILFDGFTVYHVDHFFGFFSAFNADAIKDVQLYKGGFGAQYGGRLSSVVELTGKSGNKNEFDLGFGLSALSVKARAEIPVSDDLTLFFAGRRSYTDIIQSGLYNNIADLVSPGSQNENANAGPQRGPGGGGRFFAQVEPSFYFYDLNAKATYTPGDKDVFSLSFYNGQDNLDNSFDNNLSGFGGGGTRSNETIDLTNWGNWGVSGKWARQWNDRLYTNTVLAYSNYYSERERATRVVIGNDTTSREINQGLAEDNDVRDLTLRIDNEYQVSGTNQLGFGLQVSQVGIDYSYLVNDTISVINRSDQGTTYAAYLHDEWQLFNKLTLTGGIRTTYYDINEQLYIEPRASLSYQLSKRFLLKGAWGQYNQFSNRVVREDVLQGSRDFWLLSDDEQIPVGSSEHFIAGISYETPSWLFDIEAYYKRLDGLSEYSERISQTRRDVTYEELFYEGSGTAKGIEFLAQKKIGEYTGWISYTLSEVLYDFPAFSDDLFPALHDQTHELKLVNSYQIKRWNFGATWVYSTGKPYTAPIGGYQLTLLDGNSLDYVHVGEKNAFRLPAYHRMDLSATYNFYLGNSKANVGLSLFNLYGRKNIWYKEFEVVEGELIETDVELLGLTPNLFFNFNLK